MPFEIRWVNGRPCVFTQGTDHNHGCHDTEADAKKHLAALYANVPEARSMNTFERKGFESVTTTEDEGRVHAVVSVYGNIDSDGDRVVKGAFGRTIARAKERGRFPPGVWSHDWKTPVAKTEDMWEGDDGLHVLGRFNLETTAGRETFSNIKHGIIDEYSFGFRDAVREKSGDGASEIRDLLMFEWSPTLVGANRETYTVAVKSPCACGGTSAMPGPSLAEKEDFADEGRRAMPPLILGESLPEDAERVTKAARELLSSYSEIRTKEGRALSAARRQRLQSVYDGLQQMTELINALLTETDPSPPERVNLTQQLARFQATVARLNGVRVEG